MRHGISRGGISVGTSVKTRTSAEVAQAAKSPASQTKKTKILPSRSPTRRYRRIRDVTGVGHAVAGPAAGGLAEHGGELALRQRPALSILVR